MVACAVRRRPFLHARGHRFRPFLNNDHLSTEGGQRQATGTRSSPNPFVHEKSRRRGGAFMEPSGRNRWQPVANGSAPKAAQTGRSATGGDSRLNERWPRELK